MDVGHMQRDAKEELNPAGLQMDRDLALRQRANKQEQGIWRDAVLQPRNSTGCASSEAGEVIAVADTAQEDGWAAASSSQPPPLGPSLADPRATDGPRKQSGCSLARSPWLWAIVGLAALLIVASSCAKRTKTSRVLTR